MATIFKIGEFSRLTQVSVRMLRYYDETGLLKPAQIDACTGYRLYSAKQIPILNKIIFLRDTGFNVTEIAAALNEWNNTYIANLLSHKQAEIKNEIDANNGTPVLDIKPYTPSVDRIDVPSVPAWCGTWPQSVEASANFNWEDVFNF